MIQNSFIFLERLSEKSEKNIWDQGILTWDDFIKAPKVGGFSQKRKHYYTRKLFEAKNALKDRNVKYFADFFPKSEVWRLYGHFKDDCIFLDIETTGYYGDVSVLGLYDGETFISLVKGYNLSEENLFRAFEGKKLLVTFNGLSFDSPVLKRYFGKNLPDIPHFDLRFALSRLGFDGGLKKIEKDLGIVRDVDLTDVCGADAIFLWKRYISQDDRDALKLLLSYNESDVVNLKPLADFIFSSMKSRFEKNYF